MNPLYASINQEIVRLENAQISIQDLSIQRGFGIFDFLKIVGGTPIFLDQHIDRFYKSAQSMFLDVSLSKINLKAHIYELLKKNNMPDAGLKFILTGGFSADGYTFEKSTLILNQSYFKLAREQRPTPLKLMSYNHQRQIPEVKTIDYIQAIRLQTQMKLNGADDILYRQEDYIRECPRANIFIVKGNQILTPKSEILLGITRSKILEMHLPGYEILTKDFTLNDLYQAEEVFISSSTKNATPVIDVDGIKIGNGEMGPITTSINKKLWDLIDQDVYLHNP
ncbi:MAG: amino acid aminotransferase [Pedobacter sp.]|nr:MAG: amino acid aminotransferase [Pedobacter sp.]